MVVIKSASYQTRCPFSKTLIKPKNKICLFNDEQFAAFTRIITEELTKLFPEEIIDIIIEKTGYKKLIGRFGHENISHWTKKQTSCNRTYNQEASEEESEEGSREASEEESEEATREESVSSDYTD